MADRLKLLVQKRTSLKAQITSLVNMVDKGKLDNATLRLRIARLTELYHVYEEYHDKLAVIDPNDGHQTEFVNIQERYYGLAGKVENILNTVNASCSNSDATDGIRADNSPVVVAIKRRRIKLPEAPLPTFDGKFEGWLAFKNAFTNMIGN